MLTKKEIEKESSIAQECREKISLWYSRYQKNIDNFNKMTKITMGNQWEELSLGRFSKSKKEPLTFNKLFPIVNNVIGEFAKHTPAMQVIAVSADTKNITQDITVAQDLFKSIAYSSDAKNQYRLAAKTAARGGYGVLKVYTKDKDSESFDKCIMIKAFSDPTRCFFDPNAEETTKTDGMYAGYYKTMSRKAFDKKYPKSSISSNQTVEGNIGDQITGLNCRWYDQDSVMIVNFFKKVITKTKLYRIEGSDKMPDGNYLETELKKTLSKQEIKLLPKVKEKMVDVSRIVHYKIAGDSVLKESEIKCDELPLIFVDQDSYDLDGMQVTRAIIQDAVDAQRFMNYVGSQLAHLIKLQRHDRWQATPTQMEGFQDLYTATDDMIGVIPYNPDPRAGTPMPVQIQPSAISPELNAQYNRAANDIHTSTGVFPTQIGNSGNEISGRAIDARAEHSNITNISFFVNVNAAVAVTGRIALKMFPHIYDTHRVEVMHTSQHGVKAVEINKPHESGYGIINNIKATKFALSIDANLSFEAQKQQALESLQAVLQANPQAFGLIADLFAENLPLENSIEIANRFKFALVSPEIIAAGKGEEVPPKPPAPPNPEQQMMQMKMQLEQKKMELEGIKLQNQQASEQANAQLAAAKIQVEYEKLRTEIQQSLIAANVAEKKGQVEIAAHTLDHIDKHQDREHRAAERFLKHHEIMNPIQKSLGGMYGQ